MFNVAAQLEETTREVIALTRERHTRYEQESSSLAEENEKLRLQLQTEKEKSSALSSATKDAATHIPDTPHIPTPKNQEASPEKEERMTQRYNELAQYSAQALRQNKEILTELETVKDEHTRLMREYDRERTSAVKLKRLTDENGSLRSSLESLRAEYERFKQLAGADKLLDVAQQNYNVVLRERDRLLIDKTRLGVEMDKVTAERDRLRAELLRAEKEGFARRLYQPDRDPVAGIDARSHKYWSRFREGWERSERGQEHIVHHSSSWGPVYTRQ